MSKDYFEDITPASEQDGHSHAAAEEKTGGRSIRNIPVTHRARTARAPITDERPPRGPKWKMWAIALISLLILGFIAFLFSRNTTVSVTPRTHTAVLDNTAQYSAYPNNVEEVPTDALLYETVTTSFGESTIVEASGVEQIEERASGRITIYNEFSNESVRLITQTRFETPNGLVYRIQNSINVPGQREVGGTMVPGSIDVTVYADEAGERYNSAPVERFTLPGLANSPDMFGTIYARSVTPMTGGFVGERPSVNENDKKAAETQLRSKLADKIMSEIENATPQGMYALPDFAAISYDLIPPEAEEGSGVRLTMRATVHFPVVSSDGFAYSVASRTISDAGDSIISFTDLRTFTVQAIIDDGENFILGESPLSYTLSGTASFKWHVDTEAVAKTLASREEAAFESIIASIPGIERAEARIRPPWKSSFPRDPSEIVVSLTPLEAAVTE